MKDMRWQEFFVLVYRLVLVFFFYQIARLLFWLFNRDLITVDGIGDYFSMAYYGTAFDTTAILYVNAVFILLSLLPILVNTKVGYQRFLLWWYFITNGLAFSLNFGDFVYFRFSQSRLTSSVFSVVEHESNLSAILANAVVQRPLVLVSFVVCMVLWIFLYQRVKLVYRKPTHLLVYFSTSVFMICISAVLVVGGIRGDFKHSTRPINLVDANKHVKDPNLANLVLNSVFSFFRTINTNSFKVVHFVDEAFINKEIQPYKQYDRVVREKPNIVIFIVESFGKEYSGAFNKETGIKNYVSYTPFVDSLAQHSMIFTNAFANGRQSIHGMSSVLAGIPSLTDAFTSSPYSNQKIQSLVSVANDMDYDTSFYHGAPNGSMGFQGFGNILGFKHYFGKDEYNNDKDFDGIWAIWDEPFFQYFANNLGKKQPFFSTIFTASSHDPFKIPEQYKGHFKKGPLAIHEPIQYTDMALRRFFQTASKKPWFKNTIFVITADHTNMIHYDEYQKAMNRYAIPILFYSPNPQYNLQGQSKEVVQQIDIYPSLVDLMGYHQPIRSWGRSLFSDKKEPTIIVNSNSIQEQVIIGDFIYTFDGKEIIGIYQRKDLGLLNNLISQPKTKQQELDMLKVKAWYQDYMDRIINRKLY